MFPSGPFCGPVVRRPRSDLTWASARPRGEATMDGGRGGTGEGLSAHSRHLYSRRAGRVASRRLATVDATGRPDSRASWMPSTSFTVSQFSCILAHFRRCGAAAPGQQPQQHGRLASRRGKQDGKRRDVPCQGYVAGRDRASGPFAVLLACKALAASVRRAQALPTQRARP
jgi:hypothetical protein